MCTSAGKSNSNIEVFLWKYVKMLLNVTHRYFYLTLFNTKITQNEQLKVPKNWHFVFFQP